MLKLQRVQISLAKYIHTNTPKYEPITHVLKSCTVFVVRKEFL